MLKDVTKQFLYSEVAMESTAKFIKSQVDVKINAYVNKRIQPGPPSTARGNE